MGKKKFIKDKVCEICGKRSKSLGGHMRFAHNLDNVVKNTEIEKHLEEVVAQIEPESGGMTDSGRGNLSTWDFGEINTCQICQDVYPSKIMEFHMHTKHGM